MAKTRSVYIRGTIPNLGKVPLSVRKAALPRVLQAVKESAQREAPQKRGFGSKKSIVSRITKKVLIPGQRGSVKSNAPHSHLIEFGTSQHSLAPLAKKRSRKRAMMINGSPDVLRKSAQHPGSRKNPFMERAIPGAERETDTILAAEGAEAMLEAIRTGVKLL